MNSIKVAALAACLIMPAVSQAQQQAGYYNTGRCLQWDFQTTRCIRYETKWSNGYGSSPSSRGTNVPRDGRHSNKSNADWDAYNTCRRSLAAYRCKHWVE